MHGQQWRGLRENGSFDSGWLFLSLSLSFWRGDTLFKIYLFNFVSSLLGYLAKNLVCIECAISSQELSGRRVKLTSECSFSICFLSNWTRKRTKCRNVIKSDMLTWRPTGQWYALIRDVVWCSTDTESDNEWSLVGRNRHPHRLTVWHQKGCSWLLQSVSS